jgi:hypothetical protein
MRDYWENLYNKSKSDDGLGPDIFFRTLLMVCSLEEFCCLLKVWPEMLLMLHQWAGK